jgi:dTDP-glucose pyrophosphorylase/CBS domain-containing protein
MNYSQSIVDRIIQYDQNILQSLKKMDAVNKKLLLVFDKGKFIGVLSIGDIQKAIIANIPLDTEISKIMRKNFVYAKITDDKNSILSLMQEHRVECMPVLNDQSQLVSAYIWEEVFSTKKRSAGVLLNLPVVIMAGGQGIRLKPLTNVLPKPLIPIGEKAIIELIMDKFCNVGCNNFYLSVNYKAEMIKYYFSTLVNSTYHIQYLQEESPLGTAGSLHLLKGIINTTFFVSNCDILVDQDIAEILEYHRTNKNEITVVAAIKNYSMPYGIIDTLEDGLLQSITEKPELTFKINTGFYILEPNLIDDIPEKEFYHITSLIDKLQSEKRKVGVFPVSEGSWKEIGNWKEYEYYLK